MKCSLIIAMRNETMRFRVSKTINQNNEGERSHVHIVACRRHRHAIRKGGRRPGDHRGACRPCVQQMQGWEVKIVKTQKEKKMFTLLLAAAATTHAITAGHVFAAVTAGYAVSKMCKK